MKTLGPGRSTLWVHRFAVASEDVRSIALVESAFSALAVCADPEGWYRVRRRFDSFELCWMGRRVGRRLVPLRTSSADLETAWRDVALILFPERDDSGITLLQAMEPDDAIIRLAENAYNFPGHEQEALEALHWLVRGAGSCSVLGSDPRASVRAILDAVASSS